LGKNCKKKRQKRIDVVIFDKPTYDKLYKEVPTYKLITPSVLVDRLRINGSLARQALKELENKQLIKLISSHGSQLIYTRATKADEAAAEEVKVEESKAKPAKGRASKTDKGDKTEKADKAEKAEGADDKKPAAKPAKGAKKADE